MLENILVKGHALTKLFCIEAMAHTVLVSSIEEKRTLTCECSGGCWNMMYCNMYGHVDHTQSKEYTSRILRQDLREWL